MSGRTALVPLVTQLDTTERASNTDDLSTRVIYFIIADEDSISWPRRGLKAYRLTRSR